MTDLCSHTVQVPPDTKPKRHYRNKQNKLHEMSAEGKDLAGTVLLDWFQGKEFTAGNADKEALYRKIIQALETCGKNLVHLETVDDEIKLARIHCNNEFCPICGQNESALHLKRSGRAIDRLIWSPILGYMVFTLPEEISKSRPNREVLKVLSKAAWEITKKHFGTPGGVVRTHFMGETGGKFHIHFNVLFPQQTTTGEVPLETLKAIRSEWTAFINKEFASNYTVTNTYYKFAVETGRQIHKIKYVFRPIVTPDKFITLSDEDREYIVSLKSWHNTRWFGKLANSQYKKYFKEIKVELPEDYVSTAPISGEKYYYMGIVSQKNLSCSSFQDRDSKFHQVRALDNNTFVDPRTMAFLKNLEKLDPERTITI